jgi:RimJ/RimL family protein N-acetyltransferase
MAAPTLSVRELRAGDIDPIADYWLNADPSYLEGMGVDRAKMPTREEWTAMLIEQLSTPLKEKKSYALIWEVDGKPVGHSNINKIVFGQEAYMHLHIWIPEVRKKGYGVPFIRLSLPYYFTNYELQVLYCEPYALNEAPNRTMERAGFRRVKEYVTTPGWINFEQPVRLWAMTRAEWKEATSLADRPTGKS